VGPVSDTVADFPTPLEAQLGAESRFAFKHRPLRHQRNYAEVLIKVSPTDGFAKVAAAKIIGHYFEEVNVIVGPIVGKVTSHSAVVLLEVDAQAPVTAILVDSLSGAERRQLRLLPSRRPFPFYFEGLVPARHYVLHFEGVENADSRFGSFTTPRHWQMNLGGGEGEDPANFRMSAFVVTGDNPFRNLHGAGGAGGADDIVELERQKRELMKHGTGSGVDRSEKKTDLVGGSGEDVIVTSPAVGDGTEEIGPNPGFAVWAALQRELERPWSGVDCCLHLGTQVDMGSVLGPAAALLGRASREAHGSPIREQLEMAARETLRDAYRVHWNLPGTRAALAHGSHLMLRGFGDIGALLLGPRRGSSHHEVGNNHSDGEDELEEEAALSAEGFVGGGNVHGGHDVSDEALGSSVQRAELAQLVSDTFREYQRQLWDPALGMDGHAPPVGCSSAAGQGEWHFHRFGSAGFFLMDLKEQRLFEAPGGLPPTEMPLVSNAQWSSLNNILAKSLGLLHLVVCSEVPFIDDSTEDANYKAGLPSHQHVGNHWAVSESLFIPALTFLFNPPIDSSGRLRNRLSPTQRFADFFAWPHHSLILFFRRAQAHGPELRQLLYALFTWKKRANGREVTLLSGGVGFRLESLVEHTGDEVSSPIRQVSVNYTTLRRHRIDLNAAHHCTS
jgi:hypothetical protein